MNIERPIKTQVLELLEHYMGLLRQLRDNLSEEYRALETAKQSLGSVIDERFELLALFNQQEEPLYRMIQTICGTKEPYGSFAEALDALEKSLTLEDVELHLVCDQAHTMLKAMRDQMMVVLNTAQKVPLKDPATAKLLMKAEPRPLQAIVGLLDPDQETLSS